MRINKNGQYGILLALYLTRKGRSNLTTAATELNLSHTLLSQIANKMRKAALVRSVRGPGGGYEIMGEPRIQDVINAVSPCTVLSAKEACEYAKGNEHMRPLVYFATNLSSAISSQFNRKIINLVNELTVNEGQKLARSSIVSSAVN